MRARRSGLSTARVTCRASVRGGAQAAASLPPSLPPSLLRCCGCARLTHSRNLSGEPLPPPFCHPSPSEAVYPTADESARGVRACALPACWRVACSRVRALHLGRGDLYIFGLKRSPQKIFAPHLDSIDGPRKEAPPPKVLLAGGRACASRTKPIRVWMTGCCSCCCCCAGDRGLCCGEEGSQSIDRSTQLCR